MGTWFNNNTESFFLEGGCLSEFDLMKPRQIRTRFREAEKIAKEQYNNKIIKTLDRTKLPVWIQLFFEFFDWNKGRASPLKTTPVKDDMNDVTGRYSSNVSSNSGSLSSPIVNNV